MGWKNTRNSALPHKTRYLRNPFVDSLRFLSYPLVWIAFSSVPESPNSITNPSLRQVSTLNLNLDSLHLLPSLFRSVLICFSQKLLIFIRNDPVLLHSLSFPFQSIPVSLTADQNPSQDCLQFPSLLSTSLTISYTLVSLLSTRNPRPLLFDASFNHKRLYFLHSACLCCRSFSNSPSASLRTSSRKLGSSNSSGKFNPSNTKTNIRPDVLHVNPDEITRIIEVIKNGGNDMESELNKMSFRLSHALVSEILRILNNHGVSALRFFNWVLKTNSSFKPRSPIYDQVIDNLGHFEDYGKIFLMLKELSLKGHCLTEKAFTFLTACSSVSAKVTIGRIIETLNAVGGSCRSSGIYSLIKLLCSLNSFELAIFVMEETARKTSYYNVLIAAKCRKGDFQEVRDLFDEMRRFACAPTTQSYNYLLGSLFKNNRFAEACELLQTMEELGYLPDPVTFEVVTYHACRVNRMDFAIEFLNRMLSDGLKPRITTHAAIIKGYFWSGQVLDAHKYVVDMSICDKCSVNMNYSLLASLFQVSGRVLEAGGVLYEMMEKGLKPNFPVYMRVLKDLHKLGRGDLASDLKCRFTKFHSCTDTG